MVLSHKHIVVIDLKQLICKVIFRKIFLKMKNKHNEDNIETSKAQSLILNKFLLRFKITNGTQNFNLSIFASKIYIFFHFFTPSKRQDVWEVWSEEFIVTSVSCKVNDIWCHWSLVNDSKKTKKKNVNDSTRCNNDKYRFHPRWCCSRNGIMMVTFKEN